MNNRPFVNILKLTILQIFILSNIISADVRYVSKTGTSQFPYTSWESAADSIQKCIDICNIGDTIYVANGVYKETLFTTKEISLIGSSMDSTIIDGTGLRDSTIYLGSNAYIKNFNILGKSVGTDNVYYYAILTNGNLEISNCRISQDGIGVVIIGSSCNVNNVIMTNVREGYNSGCLQGGCTNYLTNCIIISDLESNDGIRMAIGGNYYVINNIIGHYGVFTSDIGISAGWPDTVHIFNNLVSGFTANIDFDLINDSAFVMNNVSINGGWGIYAYNNHTNIKNNILVNNLKGLVGESFNENYNMFWNNSRDIYNSNIIYNYGDSDIVVDPMFVNDTTLTPIFNFDYHLQAFSPAINKGDPSILNKDGSRSDIGMFGGPYGEVYKYNDLAPRSPRNLTAFVDSSKITLKWKKNTEADTAYYNLYRDTIPNFTIIPAKLISRQKDTLFIQQLPNNIGHLYYKLTAEDKTGHVSSSSNEISVILSSTDNYYSIVHAYKLFQNYPNPFNPSTIISFNLKDKGYVKLMVYDIIGKLIKVLVNETKESGYYETEFNAKGLASGIYLYRLEVIGKGNIPVYSDLKKCILIK
ncbi:MAG: T9SS type A sorting domain-containing protein [Ignavibacteriaceae bacterium]|nr:T9SS type A sorting domain-containing protein [Ignavibacteriaceae bacterium]